MLSAINWYGEVLAMDVAREDGPYQRLAARMEKLSSGETLDPTLHVMGNYYNL